MHYKFMIVSKKKHRDGECDIPMPDIYNAKWLQMAHEMCQCVPPINASSIQKSLWRQKADMIQCCKNATFALLQISEHFFSASGGSLNNFNWKEKDISSNYSHQTRDTITQFNGKTENIQWNNSVSKNEKKNDYFREGNQK